MIKLIKSGRKVFIQRSFLMKKMLPGTIEHRYNPVKREYVDKPEHWRYSSGRDYIGLKGLVAVKPLV